MDALEALAERGYVADEDAAGLGVAYRWLRAVEHRHPVVAGTSDPPPAER